MEQKQAGNGAVGVDGGPGVRTLYCLGGRQPL